MLGHPQHPWISCASAPVYLLTYPAYDQTEMQQVARYNADQQSLYQVLEEWTRKAANPFAFVVDLSNLNSLAMNRQRAIAYLEKVKKRGNPCMAGRVFVTPNSNVRGVMTAIFWQSPPDYPHAVVESIAEGIPLAQGYVRDLENERVLSGRRGAGF